jgi:hypothetical protein
MSVRRNVPPIAACLALVAVILAAPVWAEPPAPSDPASTDPRLAPARPPEGLPVALVGPGLDYRDPDVSRCMARDGEGVPVSWDLVDDNETPFAEHSETTAFARQLCQAGSVAMIVARYGVEQPLGITDALGFVFQTPARLIVVAHQPLNQRHLQWLRMAGERAPDRLFLVAADQFPAIEPPSGSNARRPPPAIRETVLVTGSDAAKLAQAQALGFTTLEIAAQSDAAPGAALASVVARLSKLWQPQQSLQGTDMLAALRIAQPAGTRPDRLAWPPPDALAAAIQRVATQATKTPEPPARKP